MANHHNTLRRRTMLMGIAGAAVSAVLAACGGETAPTSPATARPTSVPTTTGAATTAPATVAPTSAATVAPAGTTAMRPATAAPSQMSMGRKVAIEYWHNDAGRRGELVKGFMARFNEGNFGASITDRVFPDYLALAQALQASLAARMSPAVVQVGYGYLRYFAGEVPHTPIEEVARRDPQGAEFLSTRNFSTAVLDLGRVDSVLHGMPYAMSVAVLWYNADLLRQAGVERPAGTWREVRAQARQVAERTGKNGLYIGESTNFSTYQSVVEGNGARVISGSGRDVRCTIDSPEAIEAMQFVQEMIKEKAAITLPQSQADQSFLAGNIGFLVQSTTTYQNITNSAKFTAGSALLPKWGTKPLRVSTGGNALFTFGRDTEQQAAAWEFIKFLHAPDSMTAWVKETGYVPTRLGLADNPQYLKGFFEATPLLKPGLDELPDVQPWASFPGRNGLEVEKELVDARAKILNGQEVAPILRDVTSRINQLIRG